MFNIVEVNDYIRVEPKLFGLSTKEAVEQQLKEIYKDYFDRELGRVISVVDVGNIKEGIIIPGDGAAYYNSDFRLLAWRPEMQELVYCLIEDIANFGAIMNMGVMNGMMHISQAMDDFVNFSKTNTLVGKTLKRSLKKGDACVARIVAISFKGDEPKISITMRQPGLGKTEWIADDKKRAQREIQKALKEEGGEKSKGKGKKEKKAGKKEK